MAILLPRCPGELFQRTSPVQDSAFVPQKDRVADALRFVEGWEGGIQEAIRSTPDSNISRSKLTDRCSNMLA